MHNTKIKQNIENKLIQINGRIKQIEQPKKIDGLLVDSVIDIATNKLFTIYQKPRGRDYFDLYSIIQKYNFEIKDLRMKAKLKFDWHVDPLQLASRLFEVDTHLDDPILTKLFNKNIMIDFFHKQAMNLENEIINKDAIKKLKKT